MSRLLGSDAYSLVGGQNIWFYTWLLLIVTLMTFLNTRWPFVRDGSVVVAISLLVVLVSGAAVFIRLYRMYPIESKTHIMHRRDSGLTLLDRQGRLFFTFDQTNFKTAIPLQDIPQHVQLAMVAAEDQHFYAHHGFSVRGIIRSAYLNLHAGRLHYGGSTLTQQLVKNAYFTPRKSLNRKIHELVLAFKLERYYSKDDILEMYANTAYFGENIFGIEEAARTYFDKPARELTLAEGSMLVGLLPAPSRLSLFHETDQGAQQRQQVVLARMVELGFISAAEQDTAAQAPLVLRSRTAPFNQQAPHFALYVRDYLAGHYGDEVVRRGGFTVTTTLDLDWQQVAQQQLRDHVATLARYQARNGAVVVTDPTTGQIVAMAGSVDWHEPDFGKINMAVHPRQTGSAFKPLVYATGLERRVITPASLLLDAPKTYEGGYRPRNYSGRFYGPVVARYALANSLNVPAVELAARVGPAAIVQLAERFGISTFDTAARDYLSIALGSQAVSLLELTGAYATLAHAGTRVPLTPVLSIHDKFDQSVPTPVQQSQVVLDSRIAFVVSSILSDDRARAATFGRALSTQYPAAVKTGTSQTYRDAWTVGYTPTVAVGVWIGNSDNSPMHEVAGSLGAAPLWRSLMDHFTELTGRPSFVPPPGLTALRVCQGQGLRLPAASTAGYVEYFLPGTEPTGFCRPPALPSVSPLPVDEPRRGEPQLTHREQAARVEQRVRRIQLDVAQAVRALAKDRRKDPNNTAQD